MKPRLLVYVGLPKSGTTSLTSALLASGHACAPAGKEPWVLASDLRIEHPTRRVPSFDTLDAYRGALLSPDRTLLRLDLSTNTLPSSDAIDHVEHLADTFDVRFLACLREPQSWTVSFYLHMRRDAMRHGQGETAPTAAAALSRSFAMADAGRRSHHGLAPVEVDLHYAAWLRWKALLAPWQDRFGHERFLVATFEDVTSGWATFRHVLASHVEVPVDALPATLPSENRSIHPSATVRTLLRARGSLGRVGLEPLLRLVPRRPKDRILAAIGRAQRGEADTALPLDLQERLQLSTWEDRQAVAACRSPALEAQPSWLRNERYEVRDGTGHAARAPAGRVEPP